jgi:hypothetical protein
MLEWVKKTIKNINDTPIIEIKIMAKNNDDAEILLSNFLKRNGEYMAEETKEVIEEALSILNKEHKK